MVDAPFTVVVCGRAIFSHEAEILDALDFVIISAHGLVDVVGVAGETRQAILRGACLALVDDLLAHTNVLLHHLNEEDVIDLNIMG